MDQNLWSISYLPLILPVHANAKAVESANAIDAIAYTVASYTVSGKGQYTPRDYEEYSLAHKLTHIIHLWGPAG
jgi:hypothetical protein